jgi:DNA invertase Pin-like site-specific DNA recombinase
MKIAGVTRVSSEGQTKDDRYGLSEQYEDIEKKVIELGRSTEDILWYPYQESATDASNRPQFQAILSEIGQLRDAGVLDLIVLGRADRLSRDGEDWFFSYLTALEGHGKAQVRFGRDDVDPADPNRRFLLFLYAFKARTDAQTIKENTRRGRIARARTGGKLATGSKNLFGYIYNHNTGKREKDPLTNDALRFCGELALQGKGTMQISRALWEQKGIEKCYSSIRDVLRNPAICGRTVSRWVGEDGTVTEIPLPDATPPTFTPEEFEQIQATLQETGKRLHRWEGKQKRHFYPLSGTEMVICSACTHHMSGGNKMDRGKSRRQYTHTGKYWPCSNTYSSWPAHKLESIVWDRVLKFFADPEEAERRLAEQINQGQVSNTLESELRKLQDLDAESEEAKSKLSEAWINKRIKPDKYYEMINKIESGEAARKETREKIQDRLSNLKNIDQGRLKAILHEISAQTCSYPDWILVSDELAAYQEEHGAEWEQEYKFDDGTRYAAIDPDHPIGKQVWEARQKVLRDLNIKVYVDGRSVRVIFLAPILRVDGRTSTNATWSPFRAIMSTSPQGQR